MRTRFCLPLFLLLSGFAPAHAGNGWSEVAYPLPGRPEVIGSYNAGCIVGAVALPLVGDGHQAMRLSRNRYYGHPNLIAFLEGFAKQVRKVSDWPGLLVGDISQPRGGPMLTGHASHQIGLDADIWLTPMPRRQLSRVEREEMSATNMVRPDKLDIDENPDITAKYGVRSVPTVIVFKGGQKLGQHVGLTNRDKLMKLLGIE